MESLLAVEHAALSLFPLFALYHLGEETLGAPKIAHGVQVLRWWRQAQDATEHPADDLQWTEPWCRMRPSSISK